MMVDISATVPGFARVVCNPPQKKLGLVSA